MRDTLWIAFFSFVILVTLAAIYCKGDE